MGLASIRSEVKTMRNIFKLFYSSVLIVTLIACAEQGAIKVGTGKGGFPVNTNKINPNQKLVMGQTNLSKVLIDMSVAHQANLSSSLAGLVKAQNFQDIKEIDIKKCAIAQVTDIPVIQTLIQPSDILQARLQDNYNKEVIKYMDPSEKVELQTQLNFNLNSQLDSQEEQNLDEEPSEEDEVPAVVGADQATPAAGSIDVTELIAYDLELAVSCQVSDTLKANFSAMYTGHIALLKTESYSRLFSTGELVDGGLVRVIEGASGATTVQINVPAETQVKSEKQIIGNYNKGK